MISKYYKAVIAGVSILATNFAALAADPAVAGALPENVLGYLVLAATTLGGTVLVYLKANEPTIEEAEALYNAARARAGV